ncbi:MAG: hypothetical protein MR937_00920 [Spirochaetia bacterium]|nr:hypothetical protein [Spirochaetia bacterium]
MTFCIANSRFPKFQCQSAFISTLSLQNWLSLERLIPATEKLEVQTILRKNF